jgi:hypothetical protein
MSDSATTKKKTATKSASAKSSSGSMLSNHESLFAAVESFVRSGDQFGSSTLLESTVAAIGECKNLAAVFKVPLAARHFSMDTALQWLLFLRLAPARAEQEGDKLFSEGELDSDSCLDMIAEVYDVSVSDAVFDHFEAEDDEDEEEEEE